MRCRTFGSIVIVATLACHDGPAAPSSVAGVTLTLALTHTELQQGQPDTIAMTVTNANSHAVSLSGGACEPRVYIRDASGVTVVPPGGDWMCIALLRTLNLAAGERRTTTFVWLTRPFPPGVYSVYAAFSAQEMRLATRPTSVLLN
jgi:hypothetical protein